MNEADELKTTAEAIRQQLSTEMATHLGIIMREIGDLKGQITAHNEARFAHNWDHELLSTMKATQADWDTWRRSVDRWRWMVVGGLLMVSTEVPVVVALLPLLLPGHH